MKGVVWSEESPLVVYAFIRDWGDNKLTGTEGSRHPGYAILSCRMTTTVWCDLKGKGKGTIEVKGDSFGAVIPASLCFNCT